MNNLLEEQDMHNSRPVNTPGTGATPWHTRRHGRGHDRGHNGRLRSYTRPIDHNFVDDALHQATSKGRCEDVRYRSVYRITPTLPHRLQGLELYTHTASGRKGATTSIQLYN